MKKLRKLIVWDGNNLVRRMAPTMMRLKSGMEHTGAIHGSLRSILGTYAQYRPQEVCVVFDGSGARRAKQKIYAEYKANRPTTQDHQTTQQLNAVRDILVAAGVCTLQKANVDADDIIGALACLPDRNVLIVSNDKDFLQCVGKNCKALRSLGGAPELWGLRQVVERYSIQPSQMADYLALCGDGVDNIPGLKGCGPVTAALWLKQYGSLREIVKHREELGTSWSARIRAQAADLRTFQRLTTLDTSVIGPNAMQRIVPRLVPGPYMERLIPLCARYGLAWAQRWFQTHPHSISYIQR